MGKLEFPLKSFPPATQGQNENPPSKAFLCRRHGKTRIPPRGGTMLEELTLIVTYTYTTTTHGMPSFIYLENIIKLLSAVIVAMEFWSLPGSSGGVTHG
jgi:hypothetical protein